MFSTRRCFEFGVSECRIVRGLLPLRPEVWAQDFTQKTCCRCLERGRLSIEKIAKLTAILRAGVTRCTFDPFDLHEDPETLRIEVC